PIRSRRFPTTYGSSRTPVEECSTAFDTPDCAQSQTIRKDLFLYPRVPHNFASDSVREADFALARRALNHRVPAAQKASHFSCLRIAQHEHRIPLTVPRHLHLSVRQILHLHS